MHRLVATLALLLALPVAAQVDGIGYRLSPAGTYSFPDGDAALSSGFEAGGVIGFSFGEFVELGGQYLVGIGYETDFSGLADLTPLQVAAIDALSSREVGVQRYGGELKLNLLRTGLAPYLTGGAGVIRFAPDGLDASRNIYLSAGAGVQLTGADRFAITAGGTLLSYRYNPARTFLSADDLMATGLTIDGVGQRTVLTPLARVTAQVYLGGRRPGELSDVDRAYLAQFRSGLSGLSLQVAPTVGYADFNDRFGYRETGLAGVEAGFDFGPLVGLRAFYLRGVSEDDPTDIQELQAYGALGRFRLSDGSGLVPILTLGGGFLDALEGYEPRDGFTEAQDRPFALAGLGLELPAFRRVRLTGEVRALAMSTADQDDVSSPEEVYISPFYRAGLSFAIGGSAGRGMDVVRREEADAELEAQRAELDSLAAADLARERAAMMVARDSALAAERSAFDTELESLRADAARRDSLLRVQIAEADARGDSLQADALRLDAAMARATAERAEAMLADSTREVIEVDEVEIVRETSPFASERTITLPVPRVGELYVRYGDPAGTRLLVDDQAAASAGLSEDALRARAREAIRAALAADATDTTLTDAQRAARIEAALNAALDRDLAPAPQQTTATLTDEQLREIELRLEARLLDEIRALRRDLGLPPRTGETDAPASGGEE
ncbi:MAG: hypothetical protein AAGI52_18200 [Bacteroidota bacterium]